MTILTWLLRVSGTETLSSTGLTDILEVAAIWTGLGVEEEATKPTFAALPASLLRDVLGARLWLKVVVEAVMAVVSMLSPIL